MPEPGNNSMYQQQMAVKPPVEDFITRLLDPAIHAPALALAAYLRANRMKPSWTLTNQWKAVCKGKNICRFTIFAGQPWLKDEPSRWVVTAYLTRLADYEDVVLRENLQHHLWDNVLYCCNKPLDSPPPLAQRHSSLKPPCNLWGCSPGKSWTVCGHELTNICRNGNRQFFWFYDPDEQALAAIRRLLELEKAARDAAGKM